MVRSCLLIVLCFLGLLSGNAQSIDDKEMVVYQSPSDKFVSMSLQAHKGLPRFGVLNMYREQTGGQRQGMRTVRPVRGGKNPVSNDKNKIVTMGKNNFSLLVGLKYLRPFMEDLDRKGLTTITSNMSEKESNSAFLQRFLRSQVAPNLCLTDECKNAGQGKNEFERLRNYTSFVDNCLDPLLDWSKNIMEGDELVGYHVSMLNIGNNYDFDKKGYTVYHSIILNNIFTRKQGILNQVVFNPVKPFEEALQNSIDRNKNIKFLLHIDEQTAERFQKEGIRRLYAVKKIKVKRSNKPMKSPSDAIEFTYSHESADLEMYTDEALTQHFKTVSLADLTN
ncbi:hypothetical protein [Allomuricauda sp. F6463D]|uniref:hypothetical protein n=1 Tax=Allomuricauda sp. F6463D TaxID=2926409 RepID=UPI001FF0E2D1|nr:hypothetical protein [Muricauda sp. F6463D]MCK0160952.1 hypothetical protein [Muricauda sp. F6463D]